MSIKHDIDKSIEELLEELDVEVEGNFDDDFEEFDNDENYFIDDINTLLG